MEVCQIRAVVGFFTSATDEKITFEYFVIEK